MFIRRKTIRKGQKTYTYWVFQSSYREGGKVRTKYHGRVGGNGKPQSWLQSMVEPEYPGAYGVQKMVERQEKLKEKEHVDKLYADALADVQREAAIRADKAAALEVYKAAEKKAPEEASNKLNAGATGAVAQSDNHSETVGSEVGTK